VLFRSHAVSTTVEGPYKFQDTAVPVWCHNPQVVVLPDGSYAMFHIGNGNGGSPANCTTELDAAAEGYMAPELPAAGTPGSTIHVSKSLNGPWEALTTNTLPGCNNPAPFVHTNGTIFIICNGFSLYRAPGINGPWTQVTQISISGQPAGNVEDPFLWIDPSSGVFKAFWHVYNTHQDRSECVNSTVSAYAYSEDGFKWVASPIQPYSTQVVLTSGETITVSTRERPKVLFGAGGVMTHLVNGVCSATACPNGPPTGCVDCKYANWDYTLVAPLATA